MECRICGEKTVFMSMHYREAHPDAEYDPREYYPAPFR